ncbi:MAG: septation protein SpoVG family protein [Planctomycetes bacterium]|nr:septation protein SpoVG family protein [Planctomycetota bacterium]
MQITEVRVKLVTATNDKLRAFCSITIDDDFVVRDLKVIDGTKGPFVAMPSRKLTERCPRCGEKNHHRANFCNECGARLGWGAVPEDPSGRQKLHADIAHPINSSCREAIQRRILEEYTLELDRAKDPSYKPKDIDFFDGDSLSGEPLETEAQGGRVAADGALAARSVLGDPPGPEDMSPEALPPCVEPRAPGASPELSSPAERAASLLGREQPLPPRSGAPPRGDGRGQWQGEGRRGGGRREQGQGEGRRRRSERPRDRRDGRREDRRGPWRPSADMPARASRLPVPQGSAPVEPWAAREAPREGPGTLVTGPAERTLEGLESPDRTLAGRPAERRPPAALSDPEPEDNFGEGLFS